MATMAMARTREAMAPNLLRRLHHHHHRSNLSTTTTPKTPTPPSLCRPPWILLSRTPTEERSDLAKFHSIRDDTTRPVALPRGLRYSCCLGSSSDGHLVLLDKSSYTPVVLNPAAGSTSKLPSIDHLPGTLDQPDVGYREEELSFRNPLGVLKKVVGLNSVFYEREVPFEGTVVSDKGLYFGKTVVVKEKAESLYTAVGIYGRNRKLAIARAGEKRWEALRTQEGMFQDVMHYKGWFYGVNGQGLVEAIDPTAPSARKTELLAAPKMRQEPGKRYLVESGGDLLLINRLIGRMPIEPEKGGNGYLTRSIEVFKMDLCGPRWVEMERLGNRALFIGGNHSVSVIADGYPELKGDCIYFLDDYWEHNLWFDAKVLEDFGVFNMVDKRIEPLGVFDQCYCNPAPTWVIPPAADFDSLQLPGSQEELMYLWGVRDSFRAPWLLLPRSREDEAKGICRLYSLQDKEEFYVQVPLGVHWSCCLGSSNGWIVTVDSTLVPHLTNPLTGFQIPLPPIDNLPCTESAHEPRLNINHNQNCIDAQGELYFGKCVVSWNSTANSTQCPILPATRDYVVVAIQGREQRLACARQGDWSWTLIKTIHSGFEDVIHYNGVFYAVCVTGRHIYVESLQLNGSVPEIAEELLGHKTERCPQKQYLVESLDSLLLVARLCRKTDSIPKPPRDEHRHRNDCDYDRYTVYKTTGFKVFKLSLSEHKWYEVKSLGDRSLILGGNHSLSVSVSNYPELRGNRIYFTDDHFAHKDEFYHRPAPEVDTGVFLLEDGSIEPLTPFKSHSRMPSPVFVFPTQH